MRMESIQPSIRLLGVAGPARGEYKYVQQSGGDQWGHVVLTVEPSSFDSLDISWSMPIEGTRHAARHGGRRLEREPRGRPIATSLPIGREVDVANRIPVAPREGGRACPSQTPAASSERGTLDKQPNVSVQRQCPKEPAKRGDCRSIVRCNALLGNETSRSRSTDPPERSRPCAERPRPMSPERRRPRLGSLPFQRTGSGCQS